MSVTSQLPPLPRARDGVTLARLSGTSATRYAPFSDTALRWVALADEADTGAVNTNLANGESGSSRSMWCRTQVCSLLTQLRSAVARRHTVLPEGGGQPGTGFRQPRTGSRVLPEDEGQTGVPPPVRGSRTSWRGGSKMSQVHPH